MRYIILGGGIAGITAAKTIREHDAAGDILVITNEFHPLGLFARKDLAKRLAVGISAPEELLIESQQQLDAQGVTLEYHVENTLFLNLRQVQVTHAARRGYDRLLIATGATPCLIDVPGVHLLGVHQVRDYEDVSLIESLMPDLRQMGAVIIGGGILALDLAWALTQRGVPVTVVVRDESLGLPLLPAEAGPLLERRLHADGLKVLLNRQVTAFLSEDNAVLDAVQLADGSLLPARMAISAIGVRANTEFLEGYELDEESGAIPVNTRMQTVRPEVFAAGNCAIVNGQVARNWQACAEQGRIAGLNMVGHDAYLDTPVIADLETRLYDLPFAYFGAQRPQAWAWSDGAQRFAQVALEDDRVVGAVLLGDISAAPWLWDRFRRQTPTTIRDLEALIERE